jgi:hypothetical protein
LFTTTTIRADGHVKATKLAYLARKNRNNIMYLFTIEDDEND